MILIYLSCAWIAGIFTGSIIDLPFLPVIISLIPLLFIPLLKKHRKAAILTYLSFFSFFSGGLYYQASLPAGDTGDLLYYNDRGTVEIRGLVNRYPEQSDKNILLQLKADCILLEGEWENISGTALVFVPSYYQYSYGDVLQLTGKPETPPQLEDFNYEQYLAVKGINTTIFYPKIKVLETGKGNPLIEWIYSLRNVMAAAINKVLPEPQASLTCGILLGIRSGIPDTVTEDFNHTGTAHILAISGLNLSIIAGILVTFGKRLFGRKGYAYIWLALGIIWIYTILTGLNPPVIRAAIMVTMYLAADFFGRQHNGVIALVFAAAVMTGFTPRVLWDASFQMSFTAMVGLIFIFPPLQSLCRKLIKSRFGENGLTASIIVSVADSLSISLAAVIAVWPLIACYFGVITPISPIATFFTLPALPFTIITGFLCGITGLLFLPLAQVFAWLNWLSASYILLVVRIFSFIPPMETGPLGIIPVIIYYAALVSVVIFISKKAGTDESDFLPAGISSVTGKRIIPVLLAAAIFTSAIAFSLPDGKLHVSFLDVGQGDAILVQKRCRQILVDGGPGPKMIMSSLGKEMPFWDRTIDLVVITHPDTDHIRGLLDVLERYTVKQVIYPDIQSESTLYRQITTLLAEKNITNMPVEAGQRIDFGDGVILDILNPVYSNSHEIDNDSIVIKLLTGKVSFLFTGDIRQETETSLLIRRAISECTVLKVAHHGSSSSTSTAFLNTVNPLIAVIPVGSDNRFGHPSSEVTGRLELSNKTTIYRTDIDGTVEFITDGTELRIITEK